MVRKRKGKPEPEPQIDQKKEESNESAEESNKSAEESNKSAEESNGSAVESNGGPKKLENIKEPVNPPPPSSTSFKFFYFLPFGMLLFMSTFYISYQTLRLSTNCSEPFLMITGREGLHGFDELDIVVLSCHVKNPIRVGDIVVIHPKRMHFPVLRTVLRVHENDHEVKILTKQDYLCYLTNWYGIEENVDYFNGYVFGDDYQCDFYDNKQRFLNRTDIIGKAWFYIPTHTYCRWGIATLRYLGILEYVEYMVGK